MKRLATKRICVQSFSVRKQVLEFSTIHPVRRDETPVSPNQKNKPEVEALPKKQRKKTMEEMDEEIRAAMEGRSGDGGIAGAELEGGKAVSMKRGVRDNMFRYI